MILLTTFSSSDGRDDSNPAPSGSSQTNPRHINHLRTTRSQTDHPQQPLGTHQYTPGSHTYRDMLHKVRNDNPRGTKPMQEWLREWEQNWERLARNEDAKTNQSTPKSPRQYELALKTSQTSQSPHEILPYRLCSGVRCPDMRTLGSE